VQKKVIFVAALLALMPLNAGGIDIQKIQLKGAQHIKDLKFFQDTGLISARNTAIEMQIDGFERSLIQYREAKHSDRNQALKGTLSAYERFNPEFKAIAEIFRDLVDKYQKQFNEKNTETFADTNTKEKVVATAEVGKQDESRALAAYNNRNYPYAAHLYLRSLRHYHQAFDLRKWPQLVKLATTTKGKAKTAKSKKDGASTVPAGK
jgi:hypothetical protein